MLGTNRTSSARSAMVTRIKGWAREALGVSDETTVMVTELRCVEEGCPPLETVIAVLGDHGRSTQLKLHKALDEVTRADVDEGAARLSTAHSHGH